MKKRFSKQRCSNGGKQCFQTQYLEKKSHLCPLPVAAGHVNSSNVLEELVGRDEVRQAGEELSHVDEVHAGQDILVEAKQSQSRAEQELFTISAEHIPHSTRQVQRQRLAIQSEDPEGTNRWEGKVIIS